MKVSQTFEKKHTRRLCEYATCPGTVPVFDWSVQRLMQNVKVFLRSLFFKVLLGAFLCFFFIAESEMTGNVQRERWEWYETYKVT